MHSTILARASDDFQKYFKNLKKSVILKMRKYFPYAKMQVFGVFPSRLEIALKSFFLQNSQFLNLYLNTME